MKYVILRCEDLAPTNAQVSVLLEGAKTPHLQQLAQAGAAGVLRQSEGQGAIDRFQLHRGFFGLRPEDPEASPARCYAAGANLQLESGETAWCCDFVTQRDGIIIDPNAGQIPTKEAEVLVRLLNGELESETRRWEIGHGPHHMLITKDASLHPGPATVVRSPELLVGRRWREQLPKGSLRDGLERVIDQASSRLESHAVNRVRVDLGENPANMIWLWGAVAGSPTGTFTERTGRSGVVISSSFPMRGFASCLGLDWRTGLTSFEESAVRQLMKGLGALIQQRDVAYVHVRIESGDPVERLCAMERIDRFLLAPLTELLPNHGPWRLLVAVDDRANGSVPFVGIGTGLPQQPVAQLSSAHLSQSPLTLQTGVALFEWLTKDAGRGGHADLQGTSGRSGAPVPA